MATLLILVKAHLEGFGGVEEWLKEKAEMYQYLSANDK
jgi:hypothetical protein